MNFLDYSVYANKVFGCYLGVSIGGYVGAPYEGAKERIDVRIDVRDLENMLFNDDLDLQVLFFQAVERYGLRFNSNQLAELFYKNCPYSPGEYAFFKKNYGRGILPPYSGTFNNEFYHEGMGCCIRGELWGCLFPGDPEAAKKFAHFDGCLDHGEESICSEYFVSSLISLAFVCDDIGVLLDSAAAQLPAESRLRSVIEQVLKWCETERDIDVLRDKILCEYGHPDCTNVFQNIAFVTACLKLYFDDLETLLEKTIYCGFDTDCTGGIAAAVWGTVHGGSLLLQRYRIRDVRLVLGVTCPDYGGLVRNFAEKVAEYGAYFNRRIGKVLGISGGPSEEYAFREVVLYEPVRYEPEIFFGVEKEVVIRACLPEGEKGRFEYENRQLKVLSLEEEAEGENVRLIKLRVLLEKSDCVPADLCGILRFVGEGGSDRENDLPVGFAAPVTLEVSKPLFDTSEHIRFKSGESYYPCFETTRNESLRYDRIRNYHLNYRPEGTDPLNAAELSEGGPFESRKVAVYTDKLRTGSLTGYRGPCTLYLRRTIILDHPETCMLWCGCEGPAEVWLNGKRVAFNKKTTFFNYENIHANRVRLKKGKNYLVYKLVRETGREYFSCNILKEGGVMDFPEHLLSFRQLN